MTETKVALQTSALRILMLPNSVTPQSETQETSSKRQKLRIENVWVLTVVYNTSELAKVDGKKSNEEPETIKVKNYFSCKENAEEYLANQISDLLEERFALKIADWYGDKKIPQATREDLADVHWLVEAIGVAQDPLVQTICAESSISPEMTDVWLKQYREPPPTPQFEFDQFVGILREFRQFLEWFDVSVDPDKKKDLQEELQQLHQLRTYQVWLQNVHLGEDCHSFDVLRAIEEGNARL